MFHIEINGRRRNFQTMKDAVTYCSTYFAKTGVVLGIVRN